MPVREREEVQEVSRGRGVDPTVAAAGEEESVRTNIGVFGGTFDPPHIGHLMVAHELVHQLALDRLLVIPAAVPPHKRDEQITPGGVRLAMARAAFGGEDAWEVSELELERAGPSYTVDTLRDLADRHPDAELFLALGADQLEELDSWHEPGEVLRLATVAGFARAGQEVPSIDGGTVRRVEIPRLEISSTEIRRRVGAGEPWRYMVAPGVAAIIEERGLYAEV